MIERIKNILTIVILCAVAAVGYQGYQKFFGGKIPKDPVVVVTPLPTFTPTTEEAAIVPKGHKAVGTIKPVGDPKSKRWENKETAVVISTPADGSCNTCTAFTQHTVTSDFIGISLEPKFYAGVTNGEITLGYDQGLLRWGHLTLDALVTVPYIGLGVGYNLTNNLSVLLGGNIQYFQYDKLDDFSTYSFDSTKLTTVRPVGALTFNFN